jgi:hypothetical protein
MPVNVRWIDKIHTEINVLELFIKCMYSTLIVAETPRNVLSINAYKIIFMLLIGVIPLAVERKFESDVVARGKYYVSRTKYCMKKFLLKVLETCQHHRTVGYSR